MTYSPIVVFFFLLSLTFILLKEGKIRGRGGASRRLEGTVLETLQFLFPKGVWNKKKKLFIALTPEGKKFFKLARPREDLTFLRAYQREGEVYLIPLASGSYDTEEGVNVVFPSSLVSLFAPKDEEGYRQLAEAQEGAQAGSQRKKRVSPETRALWLVILTLLALAICHMG